MRLPSPQQRTVIVGKTGSGKTVAGLWHLSQQNHHEMPWIIFDWKQDSMIAKIGAQKIPVNPRRLPHKPGIYVVQPMPGEDVGPLLWKIWAHGHIGIYLDEGYMIGESGANAEAAFQAILTQGRSKYVPVIVLSQRPVWMSRFVFSEADFYQVFWLNDKRDRKTVQSFIPDIQDRRLPDFHSYYYDVGGDELLVLKPVPREEEIIAKLQPPPKSKSLLFA